PSQRAFARRKQSRLQSWQPRNSTSPLLLGDEPGKANPPTPLFEESFDFASLLPDRCALARNKQRSRRRNLVHLRKMLLVKRQPDPTPRIDVQERITYRHVHERLDVRHAQWLLVQ